MTPIIITILAIIALPVALATLFAFGLVLASLLTLALWVVTEVFDL
jgi:hypothetical protein